MRRILIVLSLLTGLAMVAGGGQVEAERASAPEGMSRNDAARVSLGHGTACVILDNRQARCWGSNNQGQAGNAVQQTVQGRDETPDTLPTLQLGTGRSVREIQTGTQHGCAVLDNAALQCWGRNVRGQLGVPGAVGTGYSELPTANPVTDVGGPVDSYAAGYLFGCALLENGSIRCFGWGNAGRTGQGSEDDVGDDETPASRSAVSLGIKATAVAAGSSHACAILVGGEIRCWGAGNSMPFQPPGPLPENVGDDELPSDVAAFDLDGTDAVAISAGSGSTCAINVDGDVYCWGFGVTSRYSTGTNTKPVEPTKVDFGGKQATNVDLGDTHACVVFVDGTLTCWGDASNGKLGYGNVEDIGDDEPPSAGGAVALGAGRTAKAVSAGFHGTCALLDNDTVRCWGDANEIGSGQP